MTQQDFLRSLSGTASALALVWAGSASAVTLDAGDTEISVGGYVKFDAIYNVDEDLGDTAFFRGLTVPDTNVPEGSTRFHARQSRLDITTSTEINGDTLFTRIQTDFFGGGGNEVVSNSRPMRLRHAYGEYRGILAGQTWSNFQPLVFAPTIDFGGPAGYVFNRQAQIRYTTGVFSIALENPESNLTTADGSPFDTDPAAGSSSVANIDSLPDITARLAGNHGSGVYSLSAVVTQLGYDDGNNDESTSGFGVNAAGTWKAGGTTLGGQVGVYDGANRYLWQNGTGFRNGYVDSSGDIETVQDIGVMAYIDQAVGATSNVSLTLGWVDTDSDNDSAAAGINDETLTTVHINYRWNPAPPITYGIEVQSGTRELLNGNDATGSRLQFGAQYSF